jgi:hypothetical protein
MKNNNNMIIKQIKIKILNEESSLYSKMLGGCM